MLESFYRAVLPAEGFYALFEGKRKQHVWCESIDELTRETQARSEQRDLYFATSSFAHPTERTIANALHRRAFCFDIDAGEAKHAKHGDAVYPTQRAALADLGRWVQDTGLTPSWVVSSGTGLHVYFLLDEDVDIPTWRPIATHLKAMAAATSLRIDPVVTADAARILRPVETLHSSGAPVKVLLKPTGRLYALAELDEATRGYAPVTAVAPKPRAANAMFLEPPVGPPRTLAKVTKHCAAMRHAVSARGDVAEPYWRAMLGVIKFTEEGVDAAHAASEGHPDYDYAETQAKYDRWTAGPTTCETFEAENAQACAGCRFRGKVKSPILLGELNDEEAAARPPVPAPTPAPTPLPTVEVVDDDFTALGDAEDAPAPTYPWTGHVPEGFKIGPGPSGFMASAPRSIQVEDPTGGKKTIVVDTQFANVAFWFESWAAGSSDSDQAQAVFCVHDATRRTTSRYTMPTRNAAQRDAMLGTLASQNVQVYPSTQASKQLMEDYVKASLERIRAAGQRPKIADRFGTIYDSTGNLVVAQGKYLIHGDGSIVEGVVQDKLRPRSAAYRVPLPDTDAGKWGPEVWQTHILPAARRHADYLTEFYTDENFRPYQLAIMLALASPMLAFMEGAFYPGNPLPGCGLTVTLYSTRSGIGKTAAMRAAALAFGAPSALAPQLDDTNATANARHGMMLQSGTMPSFMDEMEKVEAADLAALISSVGNGASKLRMDKNTALVGGVTTALINVMSANKSHREIAAVARNESDATQLRMLEIDCTSVQEVSRERSVQESEARGALHDCAGALGALVHYQMCRAGPKVLNALGLKYADEARGALGGRQDGRFLWRALGAMMAVRDFLAMAGLPLFNRAELVAAFKVWHDAGYEFVRDRLAPKNGPDLISMMLGDLAGKTLITATKTDLRLNAMKFDIPLNEHVPHEVVARSVLNERCVYVRVDALRDWATRNKISYQGIVRMARDAGLLELMDAGDPQSFQKRFDLYTGTRMAQGVRVMVMCIRLDKLNPDLLGELAPVDNVRALRPLKEAS